MKYAWAVLRNLIVLGIAVAIYCRRSQNGEKSPVRKYLVNDKDKTSPMSARNSLDHLGNGFECLRGRMVNHRSPGLGA